MEDSFAHPTFWDKLYTTGLAAFFCAQKTVMLPMTSRCGQNMVRGVSLLAMALLLALELCIYICRHTDPSDRSRAGCSHAGTVLAAGLVRCATAGQRDHSRGRAVRGHGLLRRNEWQLRAHCLPPR